MAVPQSFPNGSQTDAAIYQFRRVTVTQLVQRAGDARLSSVVLPTFLHALIPQRPTTPILLRLKERLVIVVE